MCLDGGTPLSTTCQRLPGEQRHQKGANSPTASATSLQSAPRPASNNRFLTQQALELNYSLFHKPLLRETIEWCIHTTERALHPISRLRSSLVAMDLDIEMGDGEAALEHQEPILNQTDDILVREPR